MSFTITPDLCPHCKVGSPCSILEATTVKVHVAPADVDRPLYDYTGDSDDPFEGSEAVTNNVGLNTVTCASCGEEWAARVEAETSTPIEEPPAPPAQALSAIAKLLDGAEWNADTLDAVAELCRSAGLTVRQPDDDDDTCDECGALDGAANSIVGTHHLDTCSAYDADDDEPSVPKEMAAPTATLPAHAVAVSDDETRTSAAVEISAEEAETLRTRALERLRLAGIDSDDVAEVGGAIAHDTVPAGDGTDAAFVAVWVRVVR